MVSLRRFVGKLPLERALQRRVEMHGAYFTAKRKPINAKKRAKAMAELKQRLILQAQKTRNPSRIEILNKQIQLLRTFQQLDRIPTASEAIAALAFSAGLKSKKLLPWANALHMLNLKMKQKGEQLVQGGIGNLLPAIKNNYPARMEKTILEEQKAFTNRELSERLNSRRGNAIRMSAILLDAMGLSTKLPPESEGHGGQDLRRVHQEHRLNRITLPEKNVSFRVLKELASGKTRLTELSQTLFPDKATKTSSAPHSGLYKALEQLVRQRVVEAKRVPSKYGAVYEYYLTPAGKELVETQNERQSLHPELRKVLLGNPIGKMRITRQRKYDLIIKAVRTIIYNSNMPKRRIGIQKAVVLSRGLHTTRNVANNYIQGTYFPWQNVLLKTLRIVIMPEMRKRNPVEAQWFARYLKGQKGKAYSKPTAEDLAFAKELAQKNNYRFSDLVKAAEEKPVFDKQKRRALIKQRQEILQARRAKAEKEIAAELSAENEEFEPELPKNQE